MPTKIYSKYENTVQASANHQYSGLDARPLNVTNFAKHVDID